MRKSAVEGTQSVFVGRGGERGECKMGERKCERGKGVCKERVCERKNFVRVESVYGERECV